MGGQLGASSELNAELNLTPLIDIVLVVLIIMMVNIPIQIERMGVKLPGTVDMNPPPPNPNNVQLIVAVYPEEDGKYPLALNRRLMDEDTLFYEVTRRLRPMEKKAVFIDAHPDVPYGNVVDMMDLAREAGAAKVGLARLKDLGPKSWTSVAPGSRPRGIIIGSPTVVGYMTESTADKAIQTVSGKLMGCYNLGLAEDNTLSGRVMIRIGVGPEGEHMSEKIAQSNLDNPTVETCITEQVLPSVVYPPLGEQKTAIVQYPILFSPG